MKVQRKLTDEELQVVMDSRFHIRGVAGFACDKVFWQAVLSRLNLMATRSTTDGEYCVEPEPPIPDGYRKAVAGDEGRRDVKFWSPLASEWQGRPFPDCSFTSGDRYIVPADRVPTDEDAKSRPEVMVRDSDGQKWTKHTLLLVRDCEHSKYKFATTSKMRIEIVCWKYCRHLYPGE